MVLKLPVIIVGLALFSTGVFIFQAIGTVQTGVVAGRSRSSAAGLYVTFYYIGGTLGATVTGWMWAADGWRCVGAVADGSMRSRARARMAKQSNQGDYGRCSSRYGIEKWAAIAAAHSHLELLLLSFANC